MKKSLASLLVLSTMLLGTIAPVATEPAHAATVDTSYQTRVVEIAKSLMGKVQYEHLYEPENLKLDCSGFTYHVFKQAGINIGSIDDDVQAKVGQPVAKADVQPGDLVFFWNDYSVDSNDVGHVGIYIGNGQYIHNSNPTNDVVISSFTTTYVNEHFISARRVAPVALPTITGPATPSNIVDIAMHYKDTAKYGWTYSPTTLTFNSSAYATFVYEQAGIKLGLTATQATQATELYKKGTSIAKTNLQKGDLLFFGSVDRTVVNYVGIYLGNGVFMHSNGPGMNIMISELNIDYYNQRYMGAKRLVTAQDPAPTPVPAPVPQVTGAQVVTSAKSLQGKVQFGNTYSPTTLTFDAAGYAYYAFKQAGLDLGTRDVTAMAKLGTEVAMANLKPGDMIFFWTTTAGVPGHVGIYVGDGMYIQNADPTYDVIISSLYRTYPQSRYVTARRITAL